MTLQEPLCSHCTFKIGGPAAVFVRPRNEMQLTEALAACRQTGTAYYLLGNGSNILFSDAGYPGAVVDLTALQPDNSPGWQYPDSHSGSTPVGCMQRRPGSWVVRSGVCIWYSGHSGRSGVYERWRLWGRDEGCPGPGALAERCWSSGNKPDRCTGHGLSPQRI